MNERKKYILISAVVLIGLLVITFVPMLFSSNNNELDEPGIDTSELIPKPSATTIKDFSRRVENLPDNRIELIEEILFNTIEMNVVDGTNLNVTDAVVRDDTYKQTLDDPAKQIYYTTFIVDIPSLEQSYRVEDYYSPLPAEVSGLRDYATLVLCLDKKDLIYGEFSCTDRIRQEQGE
jgi:hypothetical protein